MIKKAFLIGAFLTIPAMALMSYVVYVARNYIQSKWGVEISPFAYNAALALAFALAFWVTAGKFLKELKIITERKRNESSES